MQSGMQGGSDVPYIMLMVLSELLLASVNAAVKAVPSWSSERIMLVRFSVNFTLGVCVCAMRGICLPAAAELATLILRGVAYCTGVTFFWTALRSCLPLGDVVCSCSPRHPSCSYCWRACCSVSAYRVSGHPL